MQKVDLGDGIVLEFDPMLVDKYYLEKYGQERIDEARLRDDDTVDTFRVRLLEMYPREDQRAYIEALFAVAETGLLGMHAMQSYALDQQRIPQVQSVFPESKNQRMVGAGKRGERYVDIPVVMDREAANELIRKANLAQHSLRERTKSLVEGYKDLIRKVIRGETTLEGVPLRSGLKVKVAQAQLALAEKVVGEELSHQVAEKALDELVTPRYLELHTDSVADEFGTIAKTIGAPFNPIHLFADYTFCCLAKDDLDIYFESTDIPDAFEREIRKASEVMETVGK